LCYGVQEPQFELQRDLAKELQSKEISRYKKIEEKSVEAKTSGIGHGSRKAGRKTSCRRVKFKFALRVIYAVITVEVLLSFVAVISVANKSSILSESTGLCHITTRSWDY
jgi:hypothetical protein